MSGRSRVIQIEGVECEKFLSLTANSKERFNKRRLIKFKVILNRS